MEYLFKAYDRKLKKSFIVDVIDFKTGYFHGDVEESDDSNGWVTRYGGHIDKMTTVDGKLVKRYVLVQYTGLKDNNGVKIFENDTIKYCETNSNFYGEKLEKICEVKNYNPYGYYPFSDEIDRKDVWLNINDIEIIGNTTDNPELLEVEL
jgi:uncharacterized phage protein (TIGR01671 family)